MEFPVLQGAAAIEYQKLLRWYMIEVTCKICRQCITPPMIQICRLRHSVCVDCSLELQNCPVCNEPAVPSRNYSMEETVATLPVHFKCKYARWGCGATLLYTDLAQHQLSCEFGGFLTSACYSTQNQHQPIANYSSTSSPHQSTNASPLLNLPPTSTEHQFNIYQLQNFVAPLTSFTDQVCDRPTLPMPLCLNQDQPISSFPIMNFPQQTFPAIPHQPYNLTPVNAFPQPQCSTNFQPETSSQISMSSNAIHANSGLSHNETFQPPTFPNIPPQSYNLAPDNGIPQSHCSVNLQPNTSSQISDSKYTNHTNNKFRRNRKSKRSTSKKNRKRFRRS